MKTLKPINFALSLTLGLFLAAISFQAIGQEYDDMYFTKSDRKTVKVEAKKASVAEVSAPTYKEAVATTENVSSKNINPEYIARYKETESANSSSYSNQDYFVEDYNKDSLITNQIDYAALNKRDQMSQSNQNRNYSYPSWGFSPYMSMGYGMGYGMPYGYGYDPFMMGYGPSYSMGFGYGSGFYPGMSMSISMAWGTGYNPWGGWGAYPYRSYGMYGYDPFAYGYGYPSHYGSRYYSPYSGYGMYGMNSYYGNSRTVVIINNTEQNQMYKPRTNRSYADSKISRTNSTENSRISTTSSRVRVPESSTTENNRIATRDYSRTQNEYYNDARRNASSTSRINTAESSAYVRNPSTRQNSSTINQNRPSRTSGFSNYSGQSTSGSRTSSYTPPSNRTSSSYSTPSRGTSSGNSNSSYSSGSNSRSSSSYSSGSSSSGSRSYSSGSSSSGSSGSSSSSGRGGRQ